MGMCARSTLFRSEPKVLCIALGKFLPQFGNAKAVGFCASLD